MQHELNRPFNSVPQVPDFNPFKSQVITPFFEKQSSMVGRSRHTESVFDRETSRYLKDSPVDAPSIRLPHDRPNLSLQPPTHNNFMSPFEIPSPTNSKHSSKSKTSRSERDSDRSRNRHKSRSRSRSSERSRSRRHSRHRVNHRSRDRSRENSRNRSKKDDDDEFSRIEKRKYLLQLEHH